jgi:hypothetical protein
LVDRLLGSEVVAPKRLGACQLTVRERNARGRRLKLGARLGQPDFIWAWIDDEKKIALVDDLAILEVDLCERATHLSAQLDAVDCGKLSKKSTPRVDIALQRPAYRDGRHGDLWRDGLTTLVVRGAEVNEQQKQRCRRADDPGPRGGSACPQAASFFDSRMINNLIHGTVRAPLSCRF